ncbi:isoleucine--tRNA ligase, cytoplasmic [Condylostylus longicornis]|uniref:isoleucine--tRNA ligase, cytoplasmic n=1 Tax=Condylostylus longicornis TaxID=2530218 RepID=UPI00244DB798|nr:isoleucine--tRNA ligase, cytoplasmic [Condylostylus longicornis]XP_055372445.1 isoleucine--tRNA ligase, cytoplasmic [Condylostylus longicornis]XP_055372447.1 isoleucine--tRNA ligase, cytoplasmic [Condylostylus longicornis]
MVKTLSKENICRVPEHINFPLEEENILSYWKSEQIFENCLKLSKGKPRYTFYDGPPFATGLPHYGHILAGTIKDVVTRYAYQQGYHVDRRFGWDCHGLPVEYEIDKTLGIKGPEDVAKMGIAAYNGECRKIVMRYAKEWEEIIGRMGRWIDFKNDYKTLYPWYMETIWWVFKQLYEKGFVYQGVKVMPYSTACTTALSNFESGQNYKEVTDPWVIAALEVLNCSNKSYILVWTTTPWTLPSNLAVCVNPNMIYVRVRDIKSKKVVILAESRLEYVFKSATSYEILEKFEGKTLAGVKYKPLFPYFIERSETMGAFRVLLDEYVTEDSGTGCVHQAPYFGEDDYRVCLANGVITKSCSIVCPVDDSGRFTEKVPDFQGQYVKDADKNIMAKMKEMDTLFSHGQVSHSYPFCWRSDTPLIYKAVPSWFIRVEHMSKNLLTCSSQTYWVPEFVKEKRFGNWLKEARDWAVSRNRYWGTPIPIWMSPNGEEVVCIGSIEELERLSGQKITDLHRESIDHITIPSSVPGGAPLRRVKEVFDCWFESGSMPFAQQHFPFENERKFVNCFPADFIAEGIDQTRGWFYTLLVISTALFNKPPFKNLIANGLVLASDGQKMSKRKKNYPDPMDVVHKYGADALRLYLINSPVVRAENLRFKEEGVRDVIKDVFLPWYNAYRFLIQNVVRLENDEKIQYFYNQDRHLNGIKTAPIMDVWILSFKESLVDFFAQEMKAYRLYTVVPRLTRFIDQLTNWYVRLNRRRIKGETGKEECIQSIDTLYDVLFSMVKMMAPFTPFLSEYIFQRLNLLQEKTLDGSVHYQMMPIVNKTFIKRDVEVAVQHMQSVIELGRVMRDRRTLPVKYPVPEVIVIHKDENYLKEILNLKDFIIGELNVRKLTVSSDKNKYGITLRAEPDHKSLGQRLKGDFKAVMAAIKSLTDSEIQRSLSNKKFDILGHEIDLEEVRIIYCISEKLGAHFEAHSDNDVLVLMDMTPNDELIEEGLAREIINRIQKLKKKAKLIPTDPVLVFYSINQQDHVVKKVAEKHKDLIQATIKSSFCEFEDSAAERKIIIEESFELKGTELQISIRSHEVRVMPCVPWTNLVLDKNLPLRFSKSREASLLLQKPSGEFLTLDELQNEIVILFGLYGIKFYIMSDKTELKNIKLAQGKTLLVTKQSSNYIGDAKESAGYPFSNYVNCEFDGKKFVIFYENPVGKNFEKEKHTREMLQYIYPNYKSIKDVKMQFNSIK